jgi:hypothetical protein
MMSIKSVNTGDGIPLFHPLVVVVQKQHENAQLTLVLANPISLARWHVRTEEGNHDAFIILASDFVPKY